MKIEPTNKIIRIGCVIERTGLSRSSIYKRCADGLLAKPISLGGRASGWLESDVNFFIDSLVAASRKNGGAE